MKMTGVDAHLVVPIARFGERVQLGILGPAASPGFQMSRFRSGSTDRRSTRTPRRQRVALELASRNRRFRSKLLRFSAARAGHDVRPDDDRLARDRATDYVWLLLRGQLAADFLVARPLKIRVAAGFNYPGMQAIGIDAVYLFRTGARSSPAKIAGTTDPTAASRCGPDRRPAAGARASPFVLGRAWGVTPKWWTPSIGPNSSKTSCSTRR
jgi:hypothetical protein